MENKQQLRNLMVKFEQMSEQNKSIVAGFIYGMSLQEQKQKEKAKKRTA